MDVRFVKVRGVRYTIRPGGRGQVTASRGAWSLVEWPMAEEVACYRADPAAYPDVLRAVESRLVQRLRDGS